MKKLPLGKQTFKDLIEENNLYIDKTKDIYNLLNDNGKYFFLSRPRRFGKSLFITTLEEIFLGNQELFKGLYIYDKIEWQKYPVIRLDFNALNYTHGSEGFERNLVNTVKDIFNKYEIILKGEDYKELFKNLIIELSKISKVVILIDEYDKPITEVIEEIGIAKKNRIILKSFYEIIKSCDEYIKFVFITGISKFSKTSVFSSLNNLKDITLNKKYSTMLGYTEEELELYFKDRVNELAVELEVTYQETKDILKLWYNGYSWNAKNFVYNPFSILSVLDDKKINNYWFNTGTPTFLIKLIKDFNLNLIKLEQIKLNEYNFESYDIDNINLYSLLFQTGYLTIKETIRNDYEYEYVLSYPNKEVKDSMLNNLLNDYAYQQLTDDISINEMVRKLRANDLEGLMNIFKSIFGTIAVKMQPDKKVSLYERELYYHTIFYLIFRLIGSKIKAEFSTSKGFIDAVAETNTHVYIFEFKMSNSEIALNQIRTKNYYESFLSSNKEIVLIGVSFDSENKNIKDWKFQSVVN
ncbi:MAG: AAA family ATPase [Candidatus Sericytochromatia bacterium]